MRSGLKWTQIWPQIWTQIWPQSQTQKVKLKLKSNGISRARLKSNLSCLKNSNMASKSQINLTSPPLCSY